MLCVLAVFVPSFFMTGVSRSLFVPLSLAVGFAMAVSYLLSSSLVPVLSMWTLRAPTDENEEKSTAFLTRVRERQGRFLNWLAARKGLVVSIYLVATVIVIGLVGTQLGRAIFPRVSSGQLLLRMRAPIGTRVEATERLYLSVLRAIQEEGGNVDITLGFVGAPPPNYPINTIYLWTSGQHEAVLRVALNEKSKTPVRKFEERLRQVLPTKFPGCQFSFEAADIVTQIMNFGAATPVEINIAGPDFRADRAFAEKLRSLIAKMPELRDVQYDEPLDYPSIGIDVDRERAGQLGVTTANVGKSFLAATSSSRFVTPNYWADPNSGVGYQVQVQVPQDEMASIEDVEHIPVTPGSATHP